MCCPTQNCKQLCSWGLCYHGGCSSDFFKLTGNLSCRALPQGHTNSGARAGEDGGIVLIKKHVACKIPHKSSAMCAAEAVGEGGREPVSLSY